MEQIEKIITSIHIMPGRKLTILPEIDGSDRKNWLNDAHIRVTLKLILNSIAETIGDDPYVGHAFSLESFESGYLAALDKVRKDFGIGK